MNDTIRFIALARELSGSSQETQRSVFISMTIASEGQFVCEQCETMAIGASFFRRETSFLVSLPDWVSEKMGVDKRSHILYHVGTPEISVISEDEVKSIYKL